MRFYTYFIRCVAFHDIPIKGRRIVSDIGLMLGVGKTPIPLLRNISVSFEIYGYLLISPIGRIKTTVDYLQIREAKPKVSDLALNLIRQNG